MHTPAHKNLKSPPGQSSIPKCKAAADGGCYCDGSCLGTKDKTLADYIKRKEDQWDKSYRKINEMYLL